MRLAAIDIGTNSIRMRVVDVPVGGARRTLDDEKAFTRIGRGLGSTGRVSEEAIEETLAVLRRMLSIAGHHGVTHVRAVATAALRQADNADAFVSGVRSELGLEVEVISAQEEGRLAFLSAAESIGAEGRWAVIDIGGGSMEVVSATDGQILRIDSLPIGVVAMSERFHSIDPMPEGERRRLVKHVRKQLARTLGEEVEPLGRLVGSGGTVTTVASLVAARRKLGLSTVHTFQLRRAEVVHLAAELVRSSAEERRAMKGMPENRIDIIVAGALILGETMRFLGADELTVNARGMREGIVIDMVARERGIDAAVDRMQAAREFGQRFHVDRSHAEHVRRLALLLFDHLAEPLGLAPGDRALLETAALLHDVGYHISYERHHKHAYHLIANSEIAGYSLAELRLVAAIARYHRGSRPKARHESMADLDERERKRVAALAALLRLADGLDRSRGQLVEDVDVALVGSVLSIGLLGDGPLDVEVHGALQKADLFEAVFGIQVQIVSAEQPERRGRSMHPAQPFAPQAGGGGEQL